MSVLPEDAFREKLVSFVHIPEEDRDADKDESFKSRCAREYLGLMMDLGDKDRKADDANVKPLGLASPSQRRFQADVAASLAELLKSLCVVSYNELESGGGAGTADKSTPILTSSLKKLARLLDVIHCVNEMDKDLQKSSRRESNDVVAIMAENDRVSF